MTTDDIIAITDEFLRAGRGVGAQLLDELRSALARYVILPNDATYDAVTVYIAATYGVPAWEHATRLVITSPEKRCGKSRLLDLIEATCHDPMITVNISPAALVRSIGPTPPTILLDEADTVFGKKAADNNEDLRGILNAGHQRNRPYIRWDAMSRGPEKCATFSMAVLAGIGDMPDTIMDRAVIVRMRRRTAGETVAPYRRRRDEPALRELADRIGEWVRGKIPALATATPDMPVEDRAADTWEPLIALADAAGGDWPIRIREACTALVAAADEEDVSSLGLRLLADLREVFGDSANLYTTTILDRLHKIDDAPWANFYGRAFNANDVSTRLKPYGVKSVNVRETGGDPKKGYRRDDLFEAWARYLPATPATGATLQVSPVAAANRTPLQAATNVAAAATPLHAATPLSREVTDVAAVADTCPECGEPYGSLTHLINCEGMDAP